MNTNTENQRIEENQYYFMGYWDWLQMIPPNYAQKHKTIVFSIGDLFTAPSLDKSGHLHSTTMYCIYTIMLTKLRYMIYYQTDLVTAEKSILVQSQTKVLGVTVGWFFKVYGSRTDMDLIAGRSTSIMLIFCVPVNQSSLSISSAGI